MGDGIATGGENQSKLKFSQVTSNHLLSGGIVIKAQK